LRKLAIIISHPIQYYAPVFKLLGQKCELKVLYSLGDNVENGSYDTGFKQNIKWDINLLDGYQYEFLNNTAKKSGSHHFKGIINPNIIQSINSFNPDAILVYGWSYQSHLKVLRHFKGKTPIWFRGDSHLLDSKPKLIKLARKALLTWVYSHIDKAFYVGTANKAYYKSFGLKQHQLLFAPHATDNDRFGTDRFDEAQILRNKLGIINGEILILFAGKLVRKKSPDRLLKAFLELNLNNSHLLIVGNGELEENLRRTAFPQAQVETENKRVHFMDFQNQSVMPVIYQACDLFVLPSQGPSETWGLAVNEAMASGKAALVSDKVGCAVDLVKAGINGEIFQANNMIDLKNKLSGLVRSKIKLIKIGQNNRKLIQNWSFEIQAKQILNLLNETR
jgi:glycosyltransferase involved in cell wall biosynthesis